MFLKKKFTHDEDGQNCTGFILCVFKRLYTYKHRFLIVKL